MKEFKVNEYITLKLEGGKTNIYVKGRLFNQCKFLLLNIPIEKITSFDEIESIDEAAEKLDRSLEGRGSGEFKIPPEVEFWGHCSNLQVWAEMDYDTRLLHRNFLAAEKRIIPIFDKVENIPFVLRSMIGLECRGNLLNTIDKVHRLILKTEKLFEHQNEAHERENGYCIRCHIEITINRYRPYCYECFEEWAKYENQNYIDNYCHKCGKKYDSTINYPLCDECYWLT